MNNPYYTMLTRVDDDDRQRTPLPAVIDELNEHQQAFAALAYRDLETAHAITAMIADFNRRYQLIETAVNAGSDHNEAGLKALESALAWDIRAIRKWRASTTRPLGSNGQ